MNNDQKEYIVTKIKKCNEEIKDTTFFQKASSAIGYMGVIGLIINANLIIENPDMTNYITNLAANIVSGTAFFTGIISTFLAITKKSKLEVNKEQLIDLLNLDKLKDYENSVPEQEENIGGKHI